MKGQDMLDTAAALTALNAAANPDKAAEMAAYHKVDRP